MWSSAVWLTLLIGYSSAGITAWNEEHSVHNKHYSQHESSVNAARKAAAERLQQHQAAALVADGPCDTLCYNGYTADGASDTETVGQGIVGFTSAGTGSAGSSQKYSSSSARMSESSVQNVHGVNPVVYPVASSSGTRSSYSSSSSSRQQHNSGLAQPAHGALYSAEHGRTHSSFVQPVAYPAVAPQAHASQSSFNERSSSERSVVSRPVVANVVYTAVPSSGSSGNSFNTRSSFTSSSNEQQHVQPVVYPTANSDYSRKYTSQQDHQYRQYPSTANTYVLYSKPISSSVQYYAPSRSRVDESASSTSYDASGRVLNVNVVQPVQTERVGEQRTQQRSETVQTVQRQSDVYPVRGSYDQQEQQEEDEVDSYSTDNTLRPTVTPGSTSSSSSSQRRQQQSSYVRTGSYVPNTGSTNRYNTVQTADNQRHQTYQSSPAYVATVPVSQSQYEGASQTQRQSHSSSNLHNVQPIPLGSSSTVNRYASTAQEQRSSTHSGASNPTYYAPAGSVAYGSQSANSASSSSQNSRYKAGSGGNFVHYPITNDEYGRRFGSTGGAGGYGADTDLHDIMSESESLARQQAHNVHNGAVAGSGTFDADTRFGGNADSDSLGTMPGGFQRTKSWSSSSKWASEQRYGDDGKPKTYSLLSTAESENHNVNGKTTGYKAATTTLEDDGKVSTYSLHTT